MLDRVSALSTVLKKIEEAPKPFKQDVCLLAVSKTQPASKIRALYEEGQRDFGENYAQELLEKAHELEDLRDLRWHFIGHLQTNKVKALLPVARIIHSVDSLRLAEEISKRGEGLGPAKIFVEVNIDGEGSKSGVAPNEARALCEKIADLPGIELQGLMCIPSAEGASRPAFARLRELETQCRPFTRGGLSMGMSGDFVEAIREGATHIRVGTALFGPRSAR